MPIGYGTTSYGTGPFGDVGGVLVPAPHGPGTGYGGVPYGHGPYGSVSVPIPIRPISSGYGGYAYGFSSYGSLGMDPGSVTGAQSISGFQIEVFFSVEMLTDGDFYDPSRYVLTPVFGGAPATSLSIEIGTSGTYGATSAIITHTGTTLGGRYTLEVVGVRTFTGMPLMPPDNEAANILCRGEPPPYTVTPVSGTELLVDFAQDMLPESSFSPGIEQLNAYAFSSNYPVPVTVTSVQHPVSGDASRVNLSVQGMTSVPYTLTISPADAIVYDPVALPSQTAGFTATEIGTGTSSISLGRLILQKPSGSVYGWAFEDTSGKILPGSSYRAEISVDASLAVYTPALFNTTLASFTVCDGAVQAVLTLIQIAGVEYVRVTSGGYVVTIPQNWSSDILSFGLVRNQQASTFTVLINGAPVASAAVASYTGIPTISQGAEFQLDPLGNYNILNFPVLGLSFSSSQTVFSSAWNFLHGTSASFLGVAELASNSFKVQYGPLVKNWGDATPATKQDVVVRINGSEVEVADVNPYIGEITLATPVPLMPPGSLSVEVDYQWMVSPIMEMVGLNKKGVVLNKYDIKPGNNTVFSSGQFTGGGQKETRFKYAIVLGPLKSRSPTQISHRYIGFQTAYSAVLNSPKTLLLNRSPRPVALPSPSKTPQGVSVAFEGTTNPLEASPAWTLLGVDATTNQEFVEAPASEVQVFNTGVYPVRAADPGPFGIGEPAVYFREEDFSLPSNILVVGRFYVDLASVTPFGVFTGVGFGAHDNQHLYMVGALLHNGVQHLGMLTEPSRPESIESWQVASQSAIEILDSSSFTTNSSSIPDFIRQGVIDEEGPRFQILTGSQAGVYRIAEILDQGDGTATVILLGSTFPADPALYNNRFYTIYFETKWDGGVEGTQPSTYRLAIKSDRKTTPNGLAQLYIGGSLTGLALTLTGAPRFSKPSESVFLFPTSDRGEVFFGSLNRDAASSSYWSFLRYGVEPDKTSFHFKGTVVAAEMSELPELDTNNIWFVTQGFGSSQIVSNRMVLKSTSSNTMPGVTGLDLSYGYARIEPFLDKTQTIDLDSTFRVESGTLGSGDAHIVIRDTEREIRLATLLYEETATERKLVETLPSISLSGLLLPEQQKTSSGAGWEKSGSLTSSEVLGQVLHFAQEPGETLSYSCFFSDYYSSVLPGRGRILEMQLRVISSTITAVSGETGIFWSTDADSLASARGVGVRLRSPEGGNPARVVLFDVDSDAVVSTYDFDWQDGEVHTYRTIIDPDTDSVSVVIDDVVVGVEGFLANFTLSGTGDRVLFGFSSTLTEASVEVSSFSSIVTPPSTVKRTLGVWRGGELDNIDNWEIPRTDSLSVKNSNLAAVVEEMDWRSDVRVRVHRDPRWGVTIFRPDLPPPPFYTGNFATDVTEPSAGWINVEYRDLPQLNNPLLQDTLITQQVSPSDPPYLGFVSFGALNPASITQQRWDEVRYRIFQYNTQDLISPRHMVLNRYNVVTSNELGKDITVEVEIVNSINNSTVSLKPANITAERVFSLKFTDYEGSTKILYPDSFRFDKKSQTVFLNEGVRFLEPPNLGSSDPVSEINPFDLEDTIGPLGGEPEEPGLGEVVVLNDAKVQIPITISFAPGKPITVTYLKKQPLWQGGTLLNEGTPPVPKSQYRPTQTVASFGSTVTDPAGGSPPDSIDNSPFRTLSFEDPADSLYENLSFFEVSNSGMSGQLASICDDQGPLSGWHEISISGSVYVEGPFFLSDGTPGSPGYAGGGQAFPPPSAFLRASGGSLTTGGNLNEAVLYPPQISDPSSLPSEPGVPGSVSWGVIGVLLDTNTMVSTILYFNSENPYP